MLDTLVYYTTTFAEGALSAFGLRGVYEQPAYTVRQDLGAHLQVRDYPQLVAAEATVPGRDRDRATNAAFMLLFGYIAGGNQGSAKIAMTAPVQSAAPQRIAMTAPAQVATADGAVTMRFFLPARVAADPPVPNDPRVRITTLPPATVAVLRFSGPLDNAARAARARDLLDRLDATNWRAVAAPFVLGYDPPFTIPWLRRNEVAVAVAPR